MNVSQVLEWIKSNVFIVVFVVLMLVALSVVPWYSGKLNAQVRADVEQRARKLDELARLKKQSYSGVAAVPGQEETHQLVINRKLVDAHEQAVRFKTEDADKVLAMAIEHNQRNHGVLMENIFPDAPSHLKDVLPRQFHERLIEAYDELLAELNAGPPPDPSALDEDLRRREANVRSQTFRKDPGDALTPEETAELERQLTSARLMNYREAAQKISFYASPYVMPIPAWDQGNQPTWPQLFSWQWDYWIYADVLRALASANEGSPSVLRAPLKRVISLQVLDDPVAGATASTGGGTTFGGGRGGSKKVEKPKVAAMNPSAPLPTDFTASFTGRVSNPMFDVRRVALDIVVDTTEIPKVLNALSQSNFITVIDAAIAPADSYEALREGYYYGGRPTSELNLVLETIWMRQWTSQFMPPDVRAYLQIPDPAPAVAASGS